jgi:hypothetical protein
VSCCSWGYSRGGGVAVTVFVREGKLAGCSP